MVLIPLSPIPREPLGLDWGRLPQSSVCGVCTCVCVCACTLISTPGVSALLL